ncbi:hepatocyte growth factor receptor-like isoform X1 [Watersipora subatra]|uniref:hepatocyte growth factor receptor-like isoform X1 n=1 Tax=Watersipora subatra TaxID=2589382 RepID=UPI00355BFF45
MLYVCRKNIFNVVLILFSEIAVIWNADGVPALFGTENPSEYPAEVIPYFLFSAVPLNAALVANITVDQSLGPLPCDEPIEITGSLHCLEIFTTQDLRSTTPTPYNESSHCPEGYQVGRSCPGSATVFSNLISSDVSSLRDEEYDVAWGHKIEPNEAINIALHFPVSFKVYSLILVVDTIPIKMDIYGSLGDETLQLIKVYQLAECPVDDPQCYTHFESQDRTLYIELTSLDFKPRTLDKLEIRLPGLTTWQNYTINYWLINEIYIDSECACQEGSCSDVIVPSDPLSVLARYSCSCTDNHSGFYCDTCTDGFYNEADTCLPCHCETGAFSERCDGKGICDCDPTLYESVDTFGDWNTKCQPYVSTISPLSGPEKGGTHVTITGGLLNQLNVTSCLPREISDIQIICVMNEGANASAVAALLRAKDKTGTETLYNFTYTSNYNISNIAPLEALASGGRTLTLNGTGLESADAVQLQFTFNCKFDERRNFSFIQSECEYVQNTQEIHCKSPSFCNITNECKDAGVAPNEDYCYEKNIENSVAATIDSLDIEVHVLVQGKLVLETKKFTVAKDPRIFAWENSLKSIDVHEVSFGVPGENLDSGVTFSDYVIIIDGAEAPAQSVNATRLIVMWPAEKPIGATDVSVGYLTKHVGMLRIKIDPLPIIAGSVTGFIVLLVVFIVLLIYWWKKKARLSIEKKFKKAAYKPGNVRYIKRNGQLSFIRVGHFVSDSALIEQLKPLLIERERLSLSTQLGSGQFGKVFKGSIQLDDGKQIIVAAKTLKADAGITEEIVCNFLKEATLMSNFNHHNVLSLIGVVYGKENMPIVVLPYMHRGDIRAMVHSENETFVLGDLLHFCMQIARGMQYLSERRFIHRDLAARNCMVDEDYVVKIADFGLSHDIYENDYYRTDENSTKPLPVKWMAIESLNTGKFTPESDVWSYGVVMWEVITRGVTPYPSVSNYEIKSHLNGGLRLQRPEYCPAVIYDMMKSCWLLDPNARPAFKTMADELAKILASAHYEERSKTKKIKSDYYLQVPTREDLEILYVNPVE